VIVDSHHHFWRYDPVEYGWISDSMRALRRDFLPADLRREAAAAGVDGVVSVQARQTLSETHALLAHARENDFIRGVVGWVPLVDPAVRGTLEELAQDPYLRACRHVLQDEPDDEYMLRRDFNEGVRAVTDWLHDQDRGDFAVNYKLRDWLISRQRYWGTPIPIVHCHACGEVPVPEDELPVLLPHVEQIDPQQLGGRSPLDAVENWVNIPCPTCGKPGRRETDTLGGFACSSWYFLRFCSPDQHEQAFDPDTVNRWMPVDLYVGGAEHSVMHLLYARFWTKAMRDAGILDLTEPFHALRHQGLMLAQPGWVDESILRVDGHTDRLPIKTPVFPSNWELSTGRAIAVVKYLIERGVPATRLAATGFGEFQPIDRGLSIAAFKRNRRIQFRLTPR